MTVLIADDDPVQRGLLETMVRRFGYETIAVDSGEAALERIALASFDLLILDLVMPNLDGMAVIERLRQRHQRLPIIVQATAGSIDAAAAAVQAGASDFVVKPVGGERLLISIRNALRCHALEEDARKLVRRNADMLCLEDLVGASAEMQRVWRLATRAAACDLPVLLEGEEGTGKQAIARAIHGASERRGKPFVVVDCAHLTQDTAQDMLFGAKDASAKGLGGKIQAAHGGSLYLDHIDALPGNVQSQLLEMMRENETGSPRSRRGGRSDARVISASSRDLISLVKAGRLREDLYYRLHVLPVSVPPLRSRRADIAELARGFLAHFAAEEGRPVRSIAPAALDLLGRYDWPGNVRQLESVMFRAVTLAQGNELSTAEFPQIAAAVGGIEIVVPPVPAKTVASAVFPVPPAWPDTSFPPNARTISIFGPNGDLRLLADVEMDMLKFAVRHCGGQMSEVARRLGIGRSTLYRRLKDLGIQDGTAIRDLSVTRISAAPRTSAALCDFKDTQVEEVAA